MENNLEQFEIYYDCMIQCTVCKDEFAYDHCFNVAELLELLDNHRCVSSDRANPLPSEIPEFTLPRPSVGKFTFLDYLSDGE